MSMQNMSTLPFRKLPMPLLPTINPHHTEPVVHHTKLLPSLIERKIAEEAPHQYDEFGNVISSKIPSYHPSHPSNLGLTKQQIHARDLSLFSYESNAHDSHLQKVIHRYGALSARGHDDHNSQRHRLHKKKKRHHQSRDTSVFEGLVEQIEQVQSERKEIVDKFLGRDLRDNGGALRGESPHGKYTFFRIWVPTAATGLKLEVQTLSGRTEAWLSTGTEYFLKSDVKQVHWKILKQLQITNSEFNWKSECYYYISVYAVTNCIFTIRANLSRKLQQEKPKGANERQAQPTRSNVRKRVLDRIKLIKESPIARSEFNRKVQRIQAEQAKQQKIKFNFERQRRNFERENILMQQRPLAEVRAAQSARHSRHQRHVQAVVHKKLLAAKQRQADLEMRLELREHQMAQRKEQEAIRKRKEANNEFAKKWLMISAQAIVATEFATQAQNLIYMLKLDKLKSWAIIKIQRWVRRHLSRKREREALIHFAKFRAYVLMCAFNLNAVKKERAANIIIWALEKGNNTHPLSKKVQNYTRKVKMLQRIIRTWKATRGAKLEMWKTQWTKVINKLIIEQKLPPAAKRIPVPIRDQLLKDHMTKLAAKHKVDMPQYMVEMKLHMHRVREETQRRRVIGDTSSVKLVPPAKPHMPVVLPKPEIRALINAAVKMVSEASMVAPLKLTSPRGGKGGKINRRATGKRMSMVLKNTPGLTR